MASLAGKRAGLSVLASAALILGMGTAATADAPLPYQNPKLSVTARVNDLLSRMTLEEKVGQMTQAERASIDKDPSLIATWNLGSVLSGGGSTPAENTPQAWADMIDTYQRAALRTRLGIPMLYGIDSVHGNGNLKGATILPHNIGIGATRDPAIARIGSQVAAQETRAIGIPWAFGPCLCVVRDDRWGRSYESYGEDPSLVTAMETSIAGLQGKRLSDQNSVLASIKHFVADGDTTYGSGRDAAGASSSNYPIDQGITQQSREHVARVDLTPYIPAIHKYNAGTVMPSYSSMDYTDDGLGNPVKMHANKELLQGWLKNTVGFDGFVISDYNGIHQIPPLSKDDSPTPYQVRAAVNAGIDMAMEPNDYQKFETRLIAEVKAGRVTYRRIDDAVRRILTKKFELGLFEKPFVDRSNLSKIGGDANRAIARKAAAASQVLLKNTSNALPLNKSGSIYVAGRNADNLGNQAGGWTITWQGMPGTHTTGTTILAGMKQAAPNARITFSEDASAPLTGYDTGVVVVGETPYAEGFGDVGGPTWGYDPSDNGTPREPKTMTLKDSDQAAVDKVCSAVKKCVVLVVSGRPQIVTQSLPKIDALVASWLPGSEGAGVADVLFGNRPFTGQLPVSWPRTATQQPLNVGDKSYSPLYPFGWGLTTRVTRSAAVVKQPAAVVKQAKAAVAAGRGDAALVRQLRLYVQNQVADPATGVDPDASDAIAKADVATLEGDYAKALRLLSSQLRS